MTRAGALAAVFAAGCGFTVTNEAPTFDQLSSDEQMVVDRILASVRAFDAAAVARGGPGIAEVIDRDAVQVHFRGLVMAANFGDGYLRLSIWDHLTGGQRAMIASWWNLDDAAAADAYPKVFYDYLATHLAAIEWIYDVQGVDRVLEDRPRFNVERDAERLSVALYDESDPTTMIDVDPLCASLRAQHEDEWSSRYDDRYFTDHIVDIADPENPTQYFYFFCRWFDAAQSRTLTLADEMELIFRRCQSWPAGCAYP